MNNVKDFGAVGDGKTVDTKAIQAAIDCGGEVYIPKGVYITGTLYLKSNGGLHLESGAVLKANTDKSDYNTDDYCVQNQVFREEYMTGAHLISAVEQENVYIKGEGVIDGNSHVWVNSSNLVPTAITYMPDANRPGQMLCFCECTDVRVSGVKLLNAPFWHMFLHGCENVQVDGITVDGEPLQFTNDGIDIDCCQNVTISNCIIKTGDDGITVRANDKPLKNKRYAENITVTNCVISSFGDYGIRIGVGYGTIRNCTFSNIVIKESSFGIGFISRFSEHASVKLMENIKFNNCIIEANRPIEFRLSNSDEFKPTEEKCIIRNVTLRDIYAKGCKTQYILGYENGEIKNIEISDSTFEICGKGKTKRVDERGLDHYESIGCGFLIKAAENIKFRNVTLKFDDDSYDWDDGIRIENSKNVGFEDCNIEKDIANV